jgi:hypothetical protein
VDIAGEGEEDRVKELEIQRKSCDGNLRWEARIKLRTDESFYGLFGGALHFVIARNK